MLDRNSFMETLRAVAEIRRTSANPLSRETILGYFEGMELTEEQKELIYDYMQLPPEEQTAETSAEEEEQETIPEQENTDSDSEEKIDFFQMYLDDIAEIDELSEQELEDSYQKLLTGDSAMIGRISETWLRTIAEMAIPFAEQGANLEDVIQEGNMGLLIKLSELVGAGNIPAINEILGGAVTEAMRVYTEEVMETQVAGMLIKDQERKND